MKFNLGIPSPLDLHCRKTKTKKPRVFFIVRYGVVSYCLSCFPDIRFLLSLLQLVLPVLGQMKIPDSTEERQKMFQIREKIGLAELLLDFLLDVLLMPYRFVLDFLTF